MDVSETSERGCFKWLLAGALRNELLHRQADGMLTRFLFFHRRFIQRGSVFFYYFVEGAFKKSLLSTADSVNVDALAGCKKYLTQIIRLIFELVNTMSSYFKLMYTSIASSDIRFRSCVFLTQCKKWYFIE